MGIPADIKLSPDQGKQFITAWKARNVYVTSIYDRLWHAYV